MREFFKKRIWHEIQWDSGFILTTCVLENKRDKALAGEKWWYFYAFFKTLLVYPFFATRESRSMFPFLCFWFQKSLGKNQYPINSVSPVLYFVFYFQSETGFPKTLDRGCFFSLCSWHLISSIFYPLRNENHPCRKSIKWKTKNTMIFLL